MSELSRVRRLVAYYWPKPGGCINSVEVASLAAAQQWEATQRVEAARIWNRDDEYDRLARGNYPRVIALVSYPNDSPPPPRLHPAAERIEWEEYDGALRASGAGWHISR